MSYTKELEIKIIRTKHKITFRMGTSLVDFMKDLESVPLQAVVDECYEYNEKTNEYILMFHCEEQEDK